MGENSRNESVLITFQEVARDKRQGVGDNIFRSFDIRGRSGHFNIAIILDLLLCCLSTIDQIGCMDRARAHPIL